MAGLELHDEVEIAGLVVVTTSDRAEQSDGPIVMARLLGAELEAALGVPADIGTWESLYEQLRDVLLAEAVPMRAAGTLLA